MARSGSGRTLGHAIIDAYRVLRRRPAISWHAMLSQLTYSNRGQELLAQSVPAGPGARNWIAWLSNERTPNARNRAGIEQAYYRYLGRVPGGLDHGTYGLITGEVAITDGRRQVDLRDRGRDGNAKLKIDHTDPAINWPPFDAALTVVDPDPQHVEEMYVVHVVLRTIPFSNTPYFPGSSYVFEVV